MKPYMDGYELAWRHRQGASIGVLAELNGCSPRAVLDEIKKVGEAPLTLKDKLDLGHFKSLGKERAELFLEGHTVEQVAEIQGVSKSAVYFWLSYNLPSNERQQYLRRQK